MTRAKHGKNFILFYHVREGKNSKGKQDSVTRRRKNVIIHNRNGTKGAFI